MIQGANGTVAGRGRVAGSRELAESGRVGGLGGDPPWCHFSAWLYGVHAGVEWHSRLKPGNSFVSL